MSPLPGPGVEPGGGGGIFSGARRLARSLACVGGPAEGHLTAASVVSQAAAAAQASGLLLTAAQRDARRKCACASRVLVSFLRLVFLEALGGIHELCDGLSACVLHRRELKVRPRQ